MDAERPPLRPHKALIAGHPSPIMEFLKNNALDFFDLGKRLLTEGKYNLSLFSLEQALQLGLKYSLVSTTGSFPKTHDVVDLLRRVSELTGNKRLEETLTSEISTLDLLKQAYIASRYFPSSYDRGAVERALRVVEVVFTELGIS
ncbi:HEPN domain-containing protein [Sulfuracidifex tepidarius]|uniref:HEPN domain-containing protein n=1 Tax=Sulfuracidifex tepidarius TaxID=1294262 RepID=UPI001E520CF7|nr:HEPN domain-containing protein [Sulfuracidifex tepidarius]